ncbi:unnamed protein product, partial [Nesidiocoris tenuis]
MCDFMLKDELKEKQWPVTVDTERQYEWGDVQLRLDQSPGLLAIQRKKSFSFDNLLINKAFSDIQVPIRNHDEQLARIAVSRSFGDEHVMRPTAAAEHIALELLSALRRLVQIPEGPFERN